MKKKFKKFNYKKIKQKPDENSAHYKQIEKDVNRTPLPKTYKDKEKEIFKDSIRSVLWAYSYLNPNVNYLQGMNFIVSCILYNLTSNDLSDIKENEINTFWLFVALLESYRLKDYYLKMKKIFELSNSLEIFLQKNQKELYDFINYKQVF